MSDSAEKPELAPRVRFARSGGDAVWDGSVSTLLEFAEEQDLSPVYGCRTGSCSACKVRLVDGSVSYLTEPFRQPEEGHVLLCCTQPEGDVILDL